MSSEVGKSGRARCDTEIFVEGVTERISQIEVDQEHSLAEPRSGEGERPGEMFAGLLALAGDDQHDRELVMGLGEPDV